MQKVFRLNENELEISPQVDIHVIDASNRYMEGLEYAFGATEYALGHLDTSKSKLGNAAYMTPVVDPNILAQMLNIARIGELLPISTTSMMGVNIVEQKSWVWQRLLLHAFKGTRVWDEIISPYFNHVSLSLILCDKSFQQNFVWDVEVPSEFFVNRQTPNAVLASRIHSLMYRSGIEDSDYNPWAFEFEIERLLEDKHGLTSRSKNEEEWDRLYNYYWRLNDYLLITDAMRAFMADRSLVVIDVDLPAKYTSVELTKAFKTEKVINTIKEYFQNLSEGVDAELPDLFADPILNLFLAEIVSHSFSMIYAGGRNWGDKEIDDFIESVISRTHSKYTFFAAVKNEYLQVSGKK